MALAISIATKEFYALYITNKMERFSFESKCAVRVAKGLC